MDVDRLPLPAEVWRRDDMISALRERDLGAVLRIAQRHTGAAQGRLAAVTGLGHGRISEVLNGKRRIERFDVIERIANGLDTPDAARMLLGLAPASVGLPQAADGVSPIAATYAGQAIAGRDIRARILSASAVDVLAVRGLGLLGLNDSLMRTALTGVRHDLGLRVLLLDPDSPAAQRRADEIGESAEGFAAGIRMTVSRLAELDAYPRLRTQVYLYRQVPVWRIISVDEVLFVSTYDAEWEGHASPMYRLEPATGGALYKGMVRMFAETLADARRVV